MSIKRTIVVALDAQCNPTIVLCVLVLWIQQQCLIVGINRTIILALDAQYTPSIIIRAYLRVSLITVDPAACSAWSQGALFCGSTSTMLARTGVGFQAAWARAPQHDGFQLIVIRRLRGSS